MSDNNDGLHIMPEFGLPYAKAEFDSQGRYHVVCPVCSEPCYPDRGARCEDATTKGAIEAYGDHFMAEALR